MQFPPGFFQGGKFGKYFLVWFDLSRDFWGYSNNLKICGSARIYRPHSSANKVCTVTKLVFQFLMLFFFFVVYARVIFLSRDFLGF